MGNITPKSLKSLFFTKKAPDASDAMPANYISGGVEANPDSQQEHETYLRWGTRVCGKVNGSLHALPAFLQKVYYDLYKSQTDNEDLQEQRKQSINARIEQLRTDIKRLDTDSNARNERIAAIDKDIDSLSDERADIKESKNRINKDQRIKLIIGLIIIIPLTFYLFVFYSSTFYSAFFRNPETMTDVGNAMFDSNAIANAFSDGVMELFFVVFAPIIFLGLGFVLHFFSVQKGITKYLKMAAVVLVTLIFDCILAYKIGDQLHTVQTFIFGDNGGYPVSVAFKDINTWAVIFCGFIVYIIWGIVFDMTLTAYQKMDFNKVRIEEINNKIDDLKNEIKEEKGRIADNDKEKIKCEGKIKQLMIELSTKVHIDYKEIYKGMTEFFSGWITQMDVLGCTPDQKQKANDIFANTNQIFLDKGHEKEDNISND
ncbi:MAG: hypothetical protein LUI08_06700 [Prevotella sp.]|nr:hypothetical protein [Prevotella sp.]